MGTFFELFLVATGKQRTVLSLIALIIEYKIYTSVVTFHIKMWPIREREFVILRANAKTDLSFEWQYWHCFMYTLSICWLCEYSNHII